MNVIRHGDVVLTETTIPKTARKQRRKRLVLAEGEMTGHAHVIDQPGAELWTAPDESVEERSAETERMFLRVLAEGGVLLTHQEHATLTVPPGEYEVRRQREYTPEAIRRVQD